MVIRILIFASICASGSPNGNVVWLKSPRITSSGRFGLHDFCPKNSFVTGMRLKIDHYHDGDNTALNGIQLMCTDMNGHDSRINSALGHYGSFGKIKHCRSGFATGFRLRSQRTQGFLSDNVGAVDFKLTCTAINGKHSRIAADDNGFLPWGHWTKDQRCPRKTAVCGIATQVDNSESGMFFIEDKTTLNNVDVACCPLERPIETCVNVKYYWKTLIACSNVAACKVKLLTGIIESKQLSKFRRFYENQWNKTGSFHDFLSKTLQAKGEINPDKINNKSLTSILQQTSLNKNESIVSVNCEGSIEQLVVTCDFIKVHTSENRCVLDQFQVPDQFQTSQESRKAKGLYFQPSSHSENILWSYNCDFTGADIASVSTGTAADCGEMCLSNTECHRFVWNNYKWGTCRMKGTLTPHTPIERYDEKIICGWVRRDRKMN